MPRTKRIRLIGKPAVFNAEVWARAVEALARQLQRETAANDSTNEPNVPKAEPGANK